MIERLCQLADLPEAEDRGRRRTDIPNAFAAGHSRKTRDGVRHHRPHAAPRAARSSRACIAHELSPHRQQGRHRDDRRRLPGDGRRPAGALRRLQRDDGRPQPRQHGVRLPRRGRGLDRRLRPVVPAPAGAVALPRVRRRPRRGDHDRRPGAARLGARRRSAATMSRIPTTRPARRRGHERLLHHPGRVARASRCRASSPPTRPSEKRIERLMAMQATLDASPDRDRSRTPGGGPASTSCADSARPARADLDAPVRDRRRPRSRWRRRWACAPTGRAGVCFKAIEAGRVRRSWCARSRSCCAATSAESGTTDPPPRRRASASRGS